MDSAKQFKKLRPDTDYELVKLLFEDLNFVENKPYKIMDFGCGAGAGDLTKTMFAPLIEKFDIQVLGVDISENMINFAKNSHSNSGIQYICADILSEDGKDLISYESLHFMFSFFVLHWLPDLKYAFQKFYELLKPGGEIRFVMCVDSGIDDMLKWISNQENWNDLAKNLKRPYPIWKTIGKSSSDYIRPLMLASGFEIDSMKEKPFLNSFSTVSDLIEFYLSFLPNHEGYKRLGQTEKSRLFEDIAQFLLSNNKISVQEDEHTVTEEAKVLLGFIRKPHTDPIIISQQMLDTVQFASEIHYSRATIVKSNHTGQKHGI